MLHRYRAVLAYDGTAYLGFQRLAGDSPSIQGTVEAAIQRVTGQPVTVVGAGRTDAGVHATGQVIAFSLVWRHDAAALVRAVNSALPADIALQTASACADDFHPRYLARSRVYEYRVISAPARDPLLRHRAWWVWSSLDAAALHDAAACIIGTHDCAAFGHPPHGSNTVRTILASAWTVQTDEAGRLHWHYRIEANAFLHHMVRRIAGMLVDVGCRRRTASQFAGAFQQAVLVKDWTTAPPHGLTLTAVRYDDTAL